MLNNFRSFAGSFMVKVMLALLVLSFGMWGVGDVLREHARGGAVATIGSSTVSQEEFARAVRAETDNLRRMLGKQYSPELASSMQLPQHVLQGLVQQKLLREEGQRIGIIASDQQVLKEITTSPAYHDENGKFKKASFDNALRQSGMSEKRFLELLRGDIASEQLSGIFQTPLPRNEIAVRTLYQGREAQRSVTLYSIPASIATNVGQPSDEQLNAYYKAREREYTIPEYRSASYAVISMKNAPGISGLPEDAQTEAYNKFINTVEDAFGGGATLSEVAQQYGLKVQGVGKMDHTGKGPDGNAVSIPPQLERFLDVAFKTDEKTESQLVPMRGSDFYVVRVESITPEHLRPLAEVKQQVVSSWQKQERSAQLDKLSQDIAQKFAASKTREETIKQYGVHGTGMSGIKRGAQNDSLPTGMLEEITQTIAGGATQAYPTKEGGYAIAVVGTVTPYSLPAAGSEQYYELTQNTHSQLNKSLQTELLDEYMMALELQHEVDINKNALLALVPEDSGE